MFLLQKCVCVSFTTKRPDAAARDSVHWKQLNRKNKSFLPSAFPCRDFGLVDDGVQEGVEEEQVVVLALVLQLQTQLVEVLQEVVDGLDGGEVRVRLPLLVAPEAGLPRPQLHLQQVCSRTGERSEVRGQSGSWILLDPPGSCWIGSSPGNCFQTKTRF